MAPSAAVPDTGPVNTDLPVRVVNNSDTPITWKYDRINYTLQPNVPMFIPYMAMVLYMGDPRAVDIDNDRRYRTDEYARLRRKYGAYERDEVWEENKPRVTAYPIDSDTPLITVVDDPLGRHLTPASDSIAQREYLQQQMQAMAAQIHALEAQREMDKQRLEALETAGLTEADLTPQDTEAKSVAPDITTPPVHPTNQPAVPPSSRVKGKVTRDGEDQVTVDQ